MSVNWLWKNKMGTIKLVQKHPSTKESRSFNINIYGANCLGALIYEYKEVDEDGKKHDMYRFWGFWNDAKHLSNCLGLTGDHKGDNLYNDPYGCGVIAKIKLNMYFKKDALKIAELFALAGHKVELYYKEIK